MNYERLFEIIVSVLATAAIMGVIVITAAALIGIYRLQIQTALRAAQNFIFG